MVFGAVGSVHDGLPDAGGSACLSVVDAYEESVAGDLRTVTAM
jgi:hypothetical protein